jgi:hypothetical protein
MCVMLLCKITVILNEEVYNISFIPLFAGCQRHVEQFGVILAPLSFPGNVFGILEGNGPVEARFVK